MKYFRSILLILLLVPAISGAVLMGQAQVTTFVVEKSGSDIVVSWTAESEDGLREYVLFRKTPFTTDWVQVQQFNAHGPGKPYRYRDTEVYKNAADMIDYRLDLVFSDGSRQQKFEQVEYTSTAVRRTWGSIKAMFQ